MIMQMFCYGETHWGTEWNWKIRTDPLSLHASKTWRRNIPAQLSRYKVNFHTMLHLRMYFPSSSSLIISLRNSLPATDVGGLTSVIGNFGENCIDDFDASWKKKRTIIWDTHRDYIRVQWNGGIFANISNHYCAIVQYCRNWKEWKGWYVSFVFQPNLNRIFKFKGKEICAISWCLSERATAIKGNSI